MKISSIVIALAVCLFSASSLLAGDKQACISLNWKGAAGGTEGKTVLADYTLNGNSATIKYHHKNGVMTGNWSNGKLVGTWAQDGSKGGGFEVDVPTGDRSTATGKWWSTTEPNKKYDMDLKYISKNKCN
ncbi:MAG: hypothetical protein HY042_07455 [Spirochaetia bacterium]|nr:hypothetical protein [Spirochaetia bacterium]